MERAGRPEVWRYRALLHGFRLHDWIRARFTPAGWLLLAAAAASAALGFDTRQSTAYQAFTFLTGLLALCMLWSLSLRRRFEIRRLLPRFGTVGQPVAYTLSVRNLSRGPASGFSVLEEQPAPHPSFEEFCAAAPDETYPLSQRLLGYDRWMGLRSARLLEGLREVPLPALPPGGGAEVSGAFTPPRRGKFRLGSVRVARPDPLGVFRAFQRHEAEQSLLVLPRRYPVPRLSLPGMRKHHQGGVALASTVGDSQEFMSLRDYRPGDPLRRIHWRSWAKAGKPIVKECQDEYFVRHALVLDTFSRGSSRAFEEAVSVAASFACSVLTQESLLDLLFVGAEAYCFTAGRGLGGPEKMLEILACAETCGDKPFRMLADSVARRRESLSGCILVLLGFDEERRGLVRRLNALRLPYQAFVIDEAGSGTAPAGGANVRRLEAGRIAEGLAGI